MSSDDEPIPDLVLPASTAVHSNVQEHRAKGAIAGHSPYIKPVPVTLITGFLGAGKTTLVNYVVTENHGLRIAVIVNEYGDSEGIERPLVKGPDDEKAYSTDWVELNNGCLCCSVKSDFVAALEGLMDKKDKFDYVLIETTGLANPGPVAAALWTDVELEAGVCLDGIVTVVDSKNIKRHIMECGEEGSVNEAQQQVAYADVILLNKMDLIPETEIASLKHLLLSINAEATIIPTTRCDLDLRMILDIAAYDSSEPGPSSEEKHHSHDHDHKGDSCEQCNMHPALHHGCDISTVAIRSQEVLMKEKMVYKGRWCGVFRIEKWLDDVLWESTSTSGSIFRAKGILNIANQSKKMILQAVHELYEIVEGTEWEQNEARFTKVVFIGKNLDEGGLKHSLASCSVSLEDM